MKQKKSIQRYEEGPERLARRIKKFLLDNGYTEKKHKALCQKLFNNA